MHLIFSFLRSGVEAKRGVEFRHATRIAFRIRRNIWESKYQYLNTWHPPCTLLHAGYSVKLKKITTLHTTPSCHCEAVFTGDRNGCGFKFHARKKTVQSDWSNLSLIILPYILFYLFRIDNK